MVKMVKHFKMDTLIKVINLVIKHDCTMSLHLKDAFTCTNASKSSQVPSVFYRSESLWIQSSMFLSNPSSKSIYQNLAAVVVYLCVQNIRRVSYLDDWLIVNSTQENLFLNREKVLDLLLYLGFIINRKKYQFPS